ncbi:MAG TPA: TraR/DksA C4-type zinc finger protein [Phycisphaerae bacterium]|nr:TraR/DksA C4-type zinc finger protein [Phycisphaerae bacterium]
MATPKKTGTRKTPSKPAVKAKPAAKPVVKAKVAAPKPKVEVKPKAAPSAVRRIEAPRPMPSVARSRPAVIEREPEPLEPQKPQVDEAWIKQMRDMLASQRQRLVSVVASTQAQMAEKSGDLADISDRASEGFEDELAVGLMAIEAAQLDDINDAIERIDKGSYGLCVDCKRAIPRKRLEVLPFAKRCLSCEGQAERRTHAAEAEDEEDELE